MGFPTRALGFLAFVCPFVIYIPQVRAISVRGDLYSRAIQLMESSPLIDTHVDLPQILQSLSRNPLDIISDLAVRVPGHVDIPKMREGRLGGAFFTVWAPCPETLGQDPGLDFMGGRIIFQYAHSSADIRNAFQNGKIASLIGLEGTHLFGNSLSTVRLFAELGVRYVTLAHVCHSAFASSNGGGWPMQPAYEGNGLTDLGRQLVSELNRLGVLVDLSHTSDETMRETIAISKAPVVWTHAGARGVFDHPRNVPNDILKLIGDGPDKNSGIILSVFYPRFIGPTPDTANVSHVADHIEHIASIVGKNHVGITSDFDGMYSSVIGLEDASKYPNLIVELLDRGWTDPEIKAVMGENLMRVMDEADAVKELLKDELPSSAIYETRTDLPAAWGGTDSMYWPYEVQEAVAKNFPKHDEL